VVSLGVSSPPRRTRLFATVVGCQAGDSLKWERFKETLPMWVADMDFASAPAIQRAVVGRAEVGAYGYSLPSAGLSASIVANVQEAWKATEADATWIRYHPGLIGGLYQAARLAGENGTVVVPTPVYPPFLNAARDSATMKTINAAEPADVFSELDRVLAETAAAPPSSSSSPNKKNKGGVVVLWCNPHNPTGRVWRREELETLADVVARHADKVTAICSDEVWSGLVFDDQATPFTSLATVAFAAEDEATKKRNALLRERLIVLTSPSKTYNVAALDFAFAVVPNANLRRRYFRAGRDQAECTPFGLAAAEAILAGGGCGEVRNDVLTPANGDCEDWRRAIIDHLRPNRDVAVDFLAAHCSPHLVVTNVPEASYLLWLDATALLRKTNNFAEYLRTNHDLVLSDGSPFFGKADSGFLRLNFACSQDLLLDALHRIKRAVDDLTTT